MANDGELARARRAASAALAPTDDDYNFDAWTAISFKRALAGRGAGLHGWSAPDWVGPHGRRLQAYRILAAYRDNAARLFLQEPDPSRLQEHREYGDGSLVVSTVLAGLLGDAQEVTAPGAEATSDSEVDPRAAQLQGWLRGWASDERLTRKMLEAERDAVSLGDGVYTLGWSPERGRVRLRCWDPGFYFPVLGDDDDFPRRVHLAWEVDGPGGARLVRRITWELVDAPGEPRRLPWNDGPTTTRCLMTDATWELPRSGAATVDDLTEGRAEYRAVAGPDGPVEVRGLDLGIDFIPVVHVPNTVAEKEHFGRSTLASVLQVLDDIANVDTDLMRASRTTGTPPLTLSGATTSGLEVGYVPGQVWNLGGEGKMDVLDTSRSLDALLKHLEGLLKRLHVNSRVPEAVVGRVSAADVPSGAALALSFGPLEAMVKEMRLTREEKYPLLLRFAQRLAWANGQPGVPDVWDVRAEVVLGSYLPADQAQAVDLVSKLLEKHAISRETATLVLVQAGFPIADAALEVERVRHEDFDGAGKLLDALGDESAVAEYLGRPAPTTPTNNAPTGG